MNNGSGFDFASLDTATASTAGRSFQPVHPTTGKGLETADGRPVLLYVAGPDSAQSRNAHAAVARQTTSEMESAMVETLRAVQADPDWKGNAEQEQKNEAYARASARVLDNLRTGQGGFEKRRSLMAALVVGWEGVSLDGESDFSTALCDKLFDRCPWLLEQADSHLGGRADFLSA